MSNNAVSIRSPLSCVRGLHANRCPRLMLTSCSWLAAIKSINENINTNFSASLSPYVRAAQRQRFPRGLWERRAARSQLAPAARRVSRTAGARTRWGCGAQTHTAVPSGNPEPCASREGWAKGRKCLFTQGLTHGLRSVTLHWTQLGFIVSPCVLL